MIILGKFLHLLDVKKTSVTGKPLHPSDSILLKNICDSFNIVIYYPEIFICWSLVSYIEYENHFCGFNISIQKSITIVQLSGPGNVLVVKCAVEEVSSEKCLSGSVFGKTSFRKLCDHKTVLQSYSRLANIYSHCLC